MDVDHPHHEFSGVGRDGAGRGSAGHQNLLLHHPVPQQQLSTEELRSSTHGPAPSGYFNGRLRVSFVSASLVAHVRPRLPGFPSYPPGCQPVGQPSPGPPHRSDRCLRIPVRPAGRDPSWDRRGLVNVSVSLAQAGLFGCRQHQHCAGRLLQGNVLCSIPFLVFSNTSSSLLKFLALAKVICNDLHVLLTTPILLKVPLPTWTSP